jgi:hypothetical protein
MSDNQSPRRIDPSIIAALIGVLGTIAVTLISIRANQQSSASTQEPTPIVISTYTLPATAAPTDTVLPNAPSSTPEPPTDTPVPTFTLVPPVAIGQDWGASCISNLWKPYPDNVPTIDKGNGCWKNPVIIFSADNGSMGFLYERGGNGPVETYGLFAPLPESGSVTFKVRLQDLSNVDLWMGVFAEADINSQGLLMTIPSGNVKKRVIVQKDIPTYETILSTQNLDQGDGYSITFTFNANSASGTVNPNVFVTNPVAIPAAEKWLFLGYKGLRGSYRVEGDFSGLEVK